MINTVTKLMGMIDLLCSACVDDVCAGDQAIPNYESNASTLHAALESELTRLFTPFTEDRLESLANKADEAFLSCNPGEYGTLSDPWWLVYGRMLEAEHGITGEKNETA
mgnify:FL=1